MTLTVNIGQMLRKKTKKQEIYLHNTRAMGNATIQYYVTESGKKVTN